MNRATDFTDYHRRYIDSRMIPFLCKSLHLCESVKSVAIIKFKV